MGAASVESVIGEASLHSHTMLFINKEKNRAHCTNIIIMYARFTRQLSLDAIP